MSVHKTKMVEKRCLTRGDINRSGHEEENDNIGRVSNINSV